MYKYIPIILSLTITVLIMLITVYVIIHRRKQKEDYYHMQEMFDKALDYDNKYKGSSSDGKGLNKLINHYYETIKGSGLIKPTRTKNDFYTKLSIIVLVVYFVSFILSSFSIFFGLIPVIILIAGIYMYAENKIKKVDNLMEDQIPSFLSTLKSNIQANQTPETALVGAIDNTADPLYSELKIVKSLIETGTFETAMTTLRGKTNSKTLKFLCSCIELSSEVGANLEHQIVIIEDMITRRKALDRKMDTAVAENKPLLYVAVGAIPGLFMFMYLTNSSTREFWFHNLISWVLFAFIILICAFAVWASNKVINNVRKL